MSDFNLDEMLQGARTIGIGGHIRPDGDCVGACLGLCLFLEEYYPDAAVTVHLDPFPEPMHFLKGAKKVCHKPEKDTVYDLFIVLDCADAERLGENICLYNNAVRTVCIDHHITNKAFAGKNYILPDASSTCEILCDLIGLQRITKPMAEALYMGMVHDTGVFQYSNTSRHTMELAGALMEMGIDHSRIVDETFYKKSYHQKQILGRALLESVRMLDGKLIFSAVRRKEMKFFEVGPADMEGIVAELRNTRGVDTAIFMYEIGNQTWKVSLRSCGLVNVAAIASAFGGGGHIRAAGCTMQGSVHDVVNNIAALAETQLKA